MRCHSPHCPQERAEGSRFCEYHRDLFAALAAEMDIPRKRREFQPVARPRTMFKECDETDCHERALPREPYCAYHTKLASGSSN